MALTFASASQQYIHAALTGISAFPFTLAIHGKPVSETRLETLIALNQTATTSSRHICYKSYPTSAKASLYTESTGNSFASVSQSWGSGTWGGIVCVFASNTSKTVYFSGGYSATTSANIAIGTPTRFTIACDQVLGNCFNGDLAEGAAWNVALTEAEAISLTKGFSPRRVRPQSLVYYVPCVRDIAELTANMALTQVGGSPTVAAHPRTYR